MASTYTPIATTTLGSAAASVTFSGISGSYTDLVLVTNANTAAVSENYAYLYFNSDTAANYSRTVLTGDGSSAASARFSNLIPITLQPTTKSNNILQIMNYSNSTTYKTCIWRDNQTASTVAAGVGLWRSTAAITSVTIQGYSANLQMGSTFTLYGIKAA